MAQAMTRNRFVTRLEKAINGSAKTQFEMAEALGYTNANIMTMFKKGTTRVPLEKVSILARELDIDPAELMRDWLATYMPDALPSLEELIGSPLSRSERSWITGLRKALGRVPPYDDRWADDLKKMVASTSAAAA